MLATGSAAMPSPAAPSAAALLASGYNLDVAFTFHNPDGTTTTDNASAAAALQAAITAGNVQRWLTGPEVNEYSVVTTVNGGKLKVEFDIRAYADGTTSTDVIFDNSWMFAPGKSDLTYDVAIRQGGTTSLQREQCLPVSLFAVGSPGGQRRHDQPERAVRCLLSDRRGGAAGLRSKLRRQHRGNPDRITISSTPPAPAGTAARARWAPREVQPYMPAPAGRPDIGPQPNWVAQWVLSQSSTAEAVMMANADASGSIPWHLFNENAGNTDPQ